VGLAVVFPQFLFIYQSGNDYRGLNIFDTDGEYFYYARVREVYDGHYRMANPLMAGKDVPYIYSPLPELIMGMTGRGLGLNLNGVSILFRFFGPAGVFLLIYFLVLRLDRGNKFSALFAATSVVLIPNLVSYPRDLLAMLRGTFSADWFTDFARPVNPQISAFFFFGFLYAYWQMLNSDRKRYLYYCLVMFGLSFYVYQYTWSFLAVFLGVQAAVLFWQKKTELLKKTLLIFGGGLVIAIPHFINFYQAAQHVFYRSLVERNGLYHSRELVFSSLSLLGAALLVPLYRYKKDLFWFFFVLVTSGIIAVNQQVITSQAIQYGHYHWAFNRPVVIILGAIVLYDVLRRLSLKSFYQYAALFVLIGVAFFYTLEIQVSSYRYYFPTYLKLQQRYGPVIEWFNSHGRLDQVVYVPESFPYTAAGDTAGKRESMILNGFIPMYTPLNVYYDGRAGLSLMPEGYDKHNLFLTLKLLDVSPDAVPAYLRADQTMLANIYGMYFKVRGLSSHDVPDEWLQDIQKDYLTFYQQPWQEILTRYPLDYIVWDQTDLSGLPLAQIAREIGFKPAYESGGVIIYETK
jgi:hypothetical protein